MHSVLIVDDHEIVVRGLAALIADKPGWEVVGQTTDATQALDIVRRRQPKVAIFDYSLGELDGAELTRRALAVDPNLMVLIFTMYQNESIIRDALAAGARGVVLKSNAEATLDEALDAMAARQPFFPGPAASILLRGFLGQDSRQSPDLTRREREVMKLIALGYSGKEIALKLEISPKTVELHRSSVLRKLNLRHMVDITRYAMRNGIVEP